MTAGSGSLAAARARGPIASRARGESGRGRSLCHLGESAAELVGQRRIIALDSAGAANQDMIGAGYALLRQDRAGEGAEAAFHAVADDRSADLLGDGETDALGGIGVSAVANQQDKARHGCATACIGREKVGALANYD